MNTKLTTFAGGAPNDMLTARHLRLGGTNREIGRGLAEAARSVHGSAAGPARSADLLVQHARRRWFTHNHPALDERIHGVADAFGVDAGDDGYDLAWLATYPVPAGCSVAVYPGIGTKDGHSLLSRNYDFPTASFTQMFGLPPLDGERPLAADPWIVELHPDKGYASIVIGIMDVMGGMDGINEAGLAVALLADNVSPNQEPSFQPQVGLSEQQIVRYLLDTCANVDEAKVALLTAKQYYIFVPCHFVVADRTGASFVWEYSPGHNVEHIVDADPAGNGRLVCTNHLLHRWPDATSLSDAQQSDGTSALSFARRTTLTERNRDGQIVDRDDIREQFRTVRFEAPTEGARTFWHAIYDLDDPSVEISFFERDDDGTSVYSHPTRISLS